ncbi:MAG: 50S ribosomal protein L32 [Proteobacteria bacterium]|nr:50S ribosomal protein L32 [Pseudomonadota bacterium]
MAVPKKKTTKSKRNMRRAHDSLAGTQVQECPNCGEMKRPHHVCGECGYYGDREVLEASEVL